jgi:hypothetical protein
MTLDEYVAQLPTSHRARKEYMALRSPGAGAMREAAAIECDALEHDFKVEADDAERKGLFNQENDYAMRSYGARACAAAIRALPLPAPEVPEEVRAWCARDDKETAKGAYPAAVDDALRGWIRKEYGI